MPEQVLCDNAFSARNTAVGLSAFDAWLIRLGIRPLHGRPRHPQTQGKVERFHGTLERWRPVYNAIRPHEATGNEPPACRWRPSERRRPGSPPEVSYPTGSELRVVGQAGDIRWHRARVLVGAGLMGERVRMVDRGHQLEVLLRHASGSLHRHGPARAASHGVEFVAGPAPPMSLRRAPPMLLHCTFHHACLVMLAFGFLALERESGRSETRPGREEGDLRPVITVPAIRRALQRMLAPPCRHDCLYCRSRFIALKTMLTE